MPGGNHTTRAAIESVNPGARNATAVGGKAQQCRSARQREQPLLSCSPPKSIERRKGPPPLDPSKSVRRRRTDNESGRNNSRENSFVQSPPPPHGARDPTKHKNSPVQCLSASYISSAETAHRKEEAPTHLAPRSTALRWCRSGAQGPRSSGYVHAYVHLCVCKCLGYMAKPLFVS